MRRITPPKGGLSHKEAQSSKEAVHYIRKYHFSKVRENMKHDRGEVRNIIKHYTWNNKQKSGQGRVNW